MPLSRPSRGQELFKDQRRAGRSRPARASRRCDPGEIGHQRRVGANRATCQTSSARCRSRASPASRPARCAPRHLAPIRTALDVEVRRQRRFSRSAVRPGNPLISRCVGRMTRPGSLIETSIIRDEVGRRFVVGYTARGAAFFQVVQPGLVAVVAVGDEHRLVGHAAR